MTPTEIVLLLILLIVVAVIAYAYGRNAAIGAGSAATSRRSSSAPNVPITNPLPAPVELPSDEPAARPDPTPPPTRTAARNRPAATPPASPPQPQPRAQPLPAQPPSRSPRASQPAATTAVASWGYQLQKLNLRQATDSPFDLLVIDYAKDGGDDSALTAAEVAALKLKPDGSRRLVLAYLSIGEAESYRGYWQSSWKRAKPSWLLAENPEWKENYAVCFWDPGWQAIICGGRQSRLDRILAAGFDGVYLDKCDVFEDMRSRRMAEAKARPDLEGDMVSFITRLSGYAKERNPAFLVVMQNAESLLDSADLRRVLDGIAKEELVYGVEQPEKKNGRDDIDYSRGQLDKMKREGKLCLVVEYLNNASKIEDAAATVAAFGYTLYISPKNRELDKLVYDQPVA